MIDRNEVKVKWAEGRLGRAVCVAWCGRHQAERKADPGTQARPDWQHVKRVIENDCVRDVVRAAAQGVDA